MDNGDVRNTYRCLSGEHSRLGTASLRFGGDVSKMCDENRKNLCEKCGAPMFLYSAEANYGNEGTSEQVYGEAYEKAKLKYLEEEKIKQEFSTDWKIAVVVSLVVAGALIAIVGG